MSDTRSRRPARRTAAWAILAAWALWGSRAAALAPPTASPEPAAAQPVPPPGRSSPEILYDRGYEGEERKFQPADNCVKLPCVVGPNGAVRFPKGIPESYSLRFGYVHEGQYRSLALFQSVLDFQDTVAQRLFNQRENLKVLNLERSLENGKYDALYVFGVLLRYPVDEGDLFVVTLANRQDRARDAQYYFRFHRQGAISDVDVSVVSPLPSFTPNPGGLIHAAQTSVAASYTLGWYLDPERSYSRAAMFGHAWKFNAVAGILSRSELKDGTIDQHADGFVGIGMTFLDFISVGYGVNLVRVPRSGFPYVGIQLKHLYDVLQSFKNQNKRWESYIAEEKQRLGP